jgi:hypothetical protein
MVNRSLLLSALGAAVFCVAAVASSSAWETERRTDYLTFNAPVGLPGVGLATGTYIFELADPDGDLSIVRVSSRDRSIVYFTGFTELVPRPAGRRGEPWASFGEASPAAPVPIAAWYPADGSAGRRFIYRKSNRQIAERAAHR